MERIVHPSSGRKLSVPDDGVVLSNRPKSWLGLAWNNILASLGESSGTRLAKGRGLARAGRVRDLWFSPGLVHAEVHDDKCFHVSLQVSVLGDDDWDLIVKLLTKNLHLVASLLEGSLSSRFLKRLKANNLQLMPTASEIQGDCNCADYLSLCAHMAAVHLILADALDGDPFLLLNLRGRNQLQLLGAVRRKWGDPKAMAQATMEKDAPLPKAGTHWYESPNPDAFDMRFTLRKPSEPTLIGLKALGPPPGSSTLDSALEPMYRSGSAAAERVAHAALWELDEHTHLLKTLLRNLGPATEHQLAHILHDSPERIVRSLNELQSNGVVSSQTTEEIRSWRLL